MAPNGNPLGVDGSIRFEVIERAAHSPRPGRNRAPFIWLGRSLTFAIEQPMHAVLKPIINVRIDVAATHGRDPVTAAENLLHLPARRFNAARRFRRTVFDDAVDLGST